MRMVSTHAAIRLFTDDVVGCHQSAATSRYRTDVWIETSTASRQSQDNPTRLQQNAAAAAIVNKAPQAGIIRECSSRAKDRSAVNASRTIAPTQGTSAHRKHNGFWNSGFDHRNRTKLRSGSTNDGKKMDFWYHRVG